MNKTVEGGEDFDELKNENEKLKEQIREMRLYQRKKELQIKEMELIKMDEDQRFKQNEKIKSNISKTRKSMKCEMGTFQKKKLEREKRKVTMKLQNDIECKKNRLKYIKKETCKTVKKIETEIKKTNKLENIKLKAAAWNNKMKEHEKLLKEQEEKKKEEIHKMYEKKNNKAEQKKKNLELLKRKRGEQIRLEKKRLKEKSVHMRQKELEKKKNKYLKQ